MTPTPISRAPSRPAGSWTMPPPPAEERDASGGSPPVTPAGARDPAPGVVRAPPGPRRSAHPERQRARPADLAGGPGGRGPVGQGELRESLHPDLEGDPELHPGQVRPDAAVDAQPERGVLVHLAVDEHLVGAVDVAG